MIAPLVLAAALGLQDTTRLTLADAVRRALESHPTVAAARDNREAAAASVGEARAPLFPRLTAGFAATQYKIGNLVYPLSGLSLTNLPLFNSTLSQASLSLGYTLFDFGGRTSQLRLAAAQERKADAALDATSAALVSRVANAYLRVLTTRGILQAQEQELAALEAESRRVAQMEAQGKAAHVEVLRLAAQASRARADEVDTRAQLDVAEHDLAQLVALPVETARAQLAPVRLADTSVADRATLVASAEQNSPDVAQARRAAEAAGAGVGVARASLLPQLQLVAAYVENGHSFTGYRPWWNRSPAFLPDLHRGQPGERDPAKRGRGALRGRAASRSRAGRGAERGRRAGYGGRRARDRGRAGHGGRGVGRGRADPAPERASRLGHRNGLPGR